jgi:hypothetical protein
MAMEGGTGMHWIYGRIIDRISDTENFRISGQIEEITISIHKI